MVDSDDYLVEVRPKIASRRLRDTVRKAPTVFLLHAAFRRALRTQHRLRNGLPSTVIVIVDTEEINDTHRKAVELALTAVSSHGRTCVASRKPTSMCSLHLRKKVKAASPIFEEYGRYDFVVVLARNRSEVPEELTILADEVVDLAAPTITHIHAVPRLLGRSLLTTLRRVQ